MGFTQFLTKKQIMATVLLTGLILLVPTRVSAQQQTGQVVPETRNPQTNAPQLFQQQTEVQSTSPQQLLNRPFMIEIPDGTPIKSSRDAVLPAPNNTKRLILLALSALAIVISVILFKRSQKPNDVKPESETSPAEKPTAPDVLPVDIPLKKRKSSKKKKSKGKPRKKR